MVLKIEECPEKKVREYKGCELISPQCRIGLQAGMTAQQPYRSKDTSLAIYNDLLTVS